MPNPTTPIATTPAPSNADAKPQLISKIQNSENVLIALNNNPTIDELSAALALSFIIGKLNKHTAAIMSGTIPNALAFLNPERTFESNTDTLRDFVVALDKEKADHLIYKIDGPYVKIFITPYHTVISEKDLEFSYGDYNVDLVISLNVSNESQLDAALASHGRILHDATVANLSTSGNSNLATINWQDPSASSISEMATTLAEDLSEKDSLIDASAATALLTGIMSATDRFSNANTKPNTMLIASKLMSKGADQQLIATNISLPGTQAATPSPAAPSAVDNTFLDISHSPAVPSPTLSSEPTPSSAPLTPPSQPIIPLETEATTPIIGSGKPVEPESSVDQDIAAGVAAALGSSEVPSESPLPLEAPTISAVPDFSDYSTIPVEPSDSYAPPQPPSNSVPEEPTPPSPSPEPTPDLAPPSEPTVAPPTIEPISQKEPAAATLDPFAANDTIVPDVEEIERPPVQLSPDTVPNFNADGLVAPPPPPVLPEFDESGGLPLPPDMSDLTPPSPTPEPISPPVPQPEVSAPAEEPSSPPIAPSPQEVPPVPTPEPTPVPAPAPAPVVNDPAAFRIPGA